MSDKVFLDSNIIVYAYDTHEPEKLVKAQSLLKSLIIQESAVVSSQVLGEFFVVVTQRIKEPLSADEAMEIIGGCGRYRLPQALIRRSQQWSRVQRDSGGKPFRRLYLKMNVEHRTPNVQHRMKNKHQLPNIQRLFLYVIHLGRRLKYTDISCPTIISGLSHGS